MWILLDFLRRDLDIVSFWNKCLLMIAEWTGFLHKWRGWTFSGKSVFGAGIFSLEGGSQVHFFKSD